jgi:hypothetical protein
MKILHHKVKFPRSGGATILAGSCWHLGQPAVHHEGIHLFMEKAKKHNWIHHGDLIEGIAPGDRRYSIDEHQESLMSCAQSAIETLKKARLTCIGVIKGNHESTPSKDVGDWSEHMAVMAGVPYLGAVCAAMMECPKGEFSAFLAHGNGSAMYKTGEPERKETNRKVKLRQILSPFRFDLCGMGHLHRGIITPPCSEMRLTLLDGEVKRRPIETRPGWNYAAPSMFRTYNTETNLSNYGEQALYPSTDIGWVEIDVDRDGAIKCLRLINEHGEAIEEVTRKIVS